MIEKPGENPKNISLGTPNEMISQMKNNLNAKKALNINLSQEKYQKNYQISELLCWLS